MAMAMQQWQPIETAPTDGTQVLLTCAPDADGVWGIRQGLFERHYWYDIDGDQIEPEFWMPLPNPPKAQG